MKKKIAIGILLLSTISPIAFADIAPLPSIFGPGTGLHTQIGNNVVIELNELNSKITTKRSIVNSINGELVPTSSVLIDRDELINQGKSYMSSCYKIEDMVFENPQIAQFMYTHCVNTGYFSAENELKFLMQKYQAKDAVFVFSKPIKIKNKMMQSGYETRFLEARVMYRNGDSEAFRSGIIVSPSMSSRNIYVKYKNSKPLEIFGRTYSLNSSGIAEIYTFKGNDLTASNADLKKVGELSGGRLSASNRYDAKVDSEGNADKSGVERLVKDASHFMNDYQSAFMLVDYVNPLEPVYDENGEMKFSISTKSRTFYRNECNESEGVKYTQNSFLRYEVNQNMSRYVVKSYDDAVKFRNIVINDDYQVGLNSDYAVADMSYEYSYGFNNEYSKFKNVLLDPIAHKNQNVFSIGSKDTYNDIDWKFYKNGGVSGLTDISVKKEQCQPKVEKCEWIRKDYDMYKYYVCDGKVKEKVCVGVRCK
ncbi:hypothetical protein [Zymobacter sp. IVIA_12111.31 C1]|uniref:hypothetical protein n=1 Tax=Zymobacter sp. IVIA_12111.31 C1 TaxID=3394854 RepID=UPI0039C3E79A